MRDRIRRFLHEVFAPSWESLEQSASAWASRAIVHEAHCEWAQAATTWLLAAKRLSACVHMVPEKERRFIQDCLSECWGSVSRCALQAESLRQELM